MVLSDFVGTSVFATLDGEASFYLRLMTGGCSALAAVPAGLQTFLDPPARAQLHHQSSAGYAAVRRRIEQLESLPPTPEDLQKVVDSIRERLDELAATAPVVADRYWRASDQQQSEIQASPHMR